MFNNINNLNQPRILSTTYQKEVVEEDDGPLYKSVNINLKRSQEIMAEFIPSPLLPSMPIPMSQKSALSSPMPMPMPMPIPSKLIRSCSGNSNSPSNSNSKEGVVDSFCLSLSSLSSPSTSTSISIFPHHRWTIRQLHEMHSDYILVRTNVYVKQDVDCSTNSTTNSQIQQPAQQLADRICQTLKSLSITIINNDDDDDDYIDLNNSAKVFVDEGSRKEENVLFVETQYDVKFAIRLFTSRSQNNNSNNMIVVEIRRTSGCTFKFRDAAKTILRSAANKQTMAIIPGGRAKAKRRFTIPLSLPKRSKEDLHRCIQDDFNIAYQMIHSRKYDTQVLGLESIEQMTRANNMSTNMNMNMNMNKSCDEMKYVVARSILGKGKNDCDNDNCDCLKRLLLLLDTTSASDHHLRTSQSSSILLRRKVLTVLANSFEAINSTTIGGESPDTLSTNDNDLTIIKTNKSLLSVLLSTLQETPIRPHDTFQAVRCLRYLLLMNRSLTTWKGEAAAEVVITAMMEINPNALDIVFSVCGGNSGSNGNGNSKQNCRHHHKGLEQESSILMAQLQKKIRMSS